MLEGLRKNAKIVIYIIAFVFILSMAIGGISGIFSPRPYVGSIDGRKIHYEEYNEYLRNAYINYMQENPDEQITEQTMRQLNEQTWNQLVAQTLYDQEIRRRRIRVRDRDIVEQLRNPDENIRSIPEFQTDGQFDYSKYEEVLLNNPQFAEYMESMIRSSLPYERLFEDVKSEVQVTEEDVRQQYYDDNNLANAKIIFFDPQSVEEVEVTDEEIRAYYEENTEDYKRGPARRLSYVRLRLEPSESDKAETKELVDEVHQQLMEGADFVDMVEQYSDDPGSAQQGGDLGYFTRGRMIPDFEEVAFDLEIGEISEPVYTRFGWHIIELMDRRRNEDGELEIRARHILIQDQASEQTRQNLAARAEDLHERAKELGLERAAEDFQYEAEETPDFFEDAQHIGGLGRSEELVDFAFSNRLGALHQPIQMQDDFIVAEISHVVGDHYQDISEVRQRINRTLENRKKREIIVEKAREFADRYEPSQYLQAATAEGIEIVEAEDISIDKQLGKIGRVEDLNRAILNKEENEFTDLIVGENGAYIALVESRSYPDMEKFEENKATLMQEAQREAEDQHLNEWYRNLMDSAEIEDNRHQFFNL
jgi:peptidyl-prolyl cis-trans isomerase D